MKKEKKTSLSSLYTGFNPTPESQQKKQQQKNEGLKRKGSF